MKRNTLFIMLFAFVCASAQEESVSYNKKQRATIILPETPNPEKGHYYRLDRVEDNQIIFEEELHPQARVPYIIVPSEDFYIDLNTLNVEGIRRDSTNINGVSFIGTYIKDNFGYKDGFYYYTIDTTSDCCNNEEKYTVDVGALRAFLQIDWRVNHENSEKEMPVVLHNKTNSLPDIKLHSNEKYVTLYDLQGRCLQKAPEKGLYIQDGKIKGVFK